MQNINKIVYVSPFIDKFYNLISLADNIWFSIDSSHTIHHGTTHPAEYITASNHRGINSSQRHFIGRQFIVAIIFSKAMENKSNNIFSSDNFFSDIKNYDNSHFRSTFQMQVWWNYFIYFFALYYCRLKTSIVKRERFFIYIWHYMTKKKKTELDQGLSYWNSLI